jgi:hypothetical protein
MMLPGSTFTIVPPSLSITNMFFFVPQGGEVEDCDEVADAGTSMWTARVLSIIVKNIQSYIVTVVWGVAEVLSLLKKENKYSTYNKKGASIEGESSLVSS